MRRTVSASIGAVYAAWMMFSITCSACAAWDSDLLERDMIAMRLPLTIMVKSGNARSTSRRTSSTGPSTVTGSSCCGIAMVRVVVATKPLLTSIYGEREDYSSSFSPVST